MRLKYAVFALCSVLFCTLFLAVSLCASSVLDEVLVIADFEDSDGGFAAGSNADGVKLDVSEFDGEDTERTFLFVECAYRYANIIRSAKCDFNEPLDLTEYRTFEYDIYVPVYEHDPNALYYVRLNLTSVDGTVSYHLGTAEGGKWCSISADIGDFDGRGSIVSAEIGLLVDTSVKKITSHGFCIDSVRASGLVDREMIGRFLFDTYTVIGADAEVARGKSAIVLSSEVAEPVSLSASVFMPDIPYPVNCLRVSLENQTASTQLIIHYTTFDSQAISEDKSVSVEIAPNSGKRYYYLPVDDVSMLHSVELLFGDGKGTIRLNSISAVYRPEREDLAVCGRITSCKLGYGGESLCIVGEINRDAAISYRDSRVAVFKWNSDILPDASDLASMMPVIEGEMTTRFELIAPIQKNDPASRYSRYIAVILHTDGSYTLIAPPFCAQDQSVGAIEAGSFDADSKGLAADDLSVICDTDSTLTVLTLKMRSAFGKKSESTPFTYGGQLYYPDASYFESVDKKIRMLSDAGVKVLLRFEGLDRSCESELTAMYAADDYVSSQRISELEDGTDYIGALAEYTAGRWAAGGSVVGVILGNGENRPAGEDVSISEQVSRTAKQIYSVYSSYISKNSQTKIYLSVTDLFDTDPIRNTNEYVLYEYIPAFISAVSKYGDFGWELCVEVSQGDRDIAEYADVTDCENLLGLLDDNGAAGKHIIFCDGVYTVGGTRLSTLMQAFVLGYCSAIFNDRIDAYIAEAGQRASVVSDTVKYIDTELSDSITSAVLLAQRKKDLGEVIDGYDSEMMPRRGITESSAAYSEPDGVKGRFPYFDFGSASGISDMWSGCYSKDIRISTDGGTAMTVLLDGAAYGDTGRASWSGVSHRFGHTENMKLTPVIRVELKLDAVIPATVSAVPVKLVLTSENERFESLGTVYVGDWTSIYFDIKDFGDIKNTDTVRILVGESKIYSAELSIKSIEGLSFDYDDEALAEAIAKERLKKLTPDEAADRSVYYWIVGGILIAAATVLILVLLSRRKGERDE